MYVSEIMTRHAVTVEMDDTLERVKEIFDNASFHHLLVLERGRLVGVISDRDLLRAISPNVGGINETHSDRVTLKRRAHQIMSRKLITASPDDDLEDAVDLLLAHHVSCLPVVNPHGHPMGVVSWRDILDGVRGTGASDHETAAA